MASESKRLKRKVRNSYVISTVSIALVLFLLGSVGYLILNALHATDKMKESVTVYVMLSDGTSDGRKEKIKTDLVAQPGVKEAVFVSKEKAAAEFKEYIGGDFVEFLESNPLPDSFEVKMNAREVDKLAIGALEKKVLTWEGVDEVVYQRNVLEQITSNINKFNLVLLIFGATLLVISLILLGNTIRVSIYSKRYIISTMKLVGASRWFIMKPFIGSAVIQGIWAALIAMLMFGAMLAGLSEGLPEIGLIRERTPLLIILGAMLVLGVLISVIFTTFAVRKFTRMHTSKIYLY